MRLDTAARTATLSTKEVVEFGVALVATGANVRRLRVDGAQLEGIHYLRTLGNADAIRADAERGRARRARRRLLHRVRGGRDADGARPPLHDGDARGRAALVALRRRRPAAFFARAAARPRRRARHAATGSSGSRARSAWSGSSPPRAATLDADIVVMGTGAMPDVMLARAAKLELGETRRRGVLRRPRDVGRAASGRPATCASTTPCCTAAACGSSTTRSRSRRAEAAAAAMLGDARAVRRGALLLDRPRRLGDRGVGRADRGARAGDRARQRRGRRVQRAPPRRRAARRARCRSAAARTSPTRAG